MPQLPLSLNWHCSWQLSIKNCDIHLYNVLKTRTSIDLYFKSLAIKCAKVEHLKKKKKTTK